MKFLSKMNKSHFIRYMSQKGITPQSLWEDALRCRKPDMVNRTFNDNVEKKFWKSHSQVYDTLPSLYDYAPHIFEKLLGYIGKEKKLIEIGCGTGKFTLPMSSYARSIVAVDSSVHMLEKMREKLSIQKIQNIRIHHNIFEKATLPVSDALYAVNANYRMISLEENLLKMKSLVREKVVLVWTQSRSPYDFFLNKEAPPGIERGQEYIHLIVMLYSMGIDPSLEIVPVIKPVAIQSLEKHHQAIDFLCEQHGLNSTSMKKDFDNSLVLTSNGQRIYNQALTVAMIIF